MRFAPFLFILVLLMACPAPEEPLPTGPPIAVDYAAACDSTNHQRLVTVEGYLNLFPRLLSCYPDEEARSGRSCQVKLMPAVDAPSETVEQERDYPTLFIDDGHRPNEARSRGYGFGPPLKVFTADSTEIDPYDRVRVTGRFSVRDRIGGDGLQCTMDVDQIEVAVRAVVSWADEREADRQALRARIDSSQAAYDSLRAVHGHDEDNADSSDG
ncbi:MAG: hypothetical protein HKN04_15405 [Rhodothermaceae bacterium]|nr:hypothetical protein [Rhodothermaceae bacterium]